MINGKIAGFGHMDDPELAKIVESNPGLHKISAEGKLVMPAFCDSHTHLVYGGSRELEYMDKIRGLSYEEIARRGGGIPNSSPSSTSCSRGTSPVNPLIL